MIVFDAELSLKIAIIKQSLFKNLTMNKHFQTLQFLFFLEKNFSADNLNAKTKELFINVMNKSIKLRIKIYLVNTIRPNWWNSKTWRNCGQIVAASCLWTRPKGFIGITALTEMQFIFHVLFRLYDVMAWLKIKPIR